MSAGAEENRKAGRIALGLVLVLAVAGGGWWWWQHKDPAAPAAAPPAAPLQEMAEVDIPPVQHPLDVPTETAAAPDAPPPDPDTDARGAFTDSFGAAVVDLLVGEQFARRLVATVDNLDRNASFDKIRPVRPPGTPFLVEREVLDATAGTERIAIAPANFARYDAAVGLLARADAATAAAAYRRIYPHLQAAYEDLGYPNRYFNDRVVAVMDHLLATPEPAGTLLLEQPKVLYRFADADLEARSPGQKLLLRMGPTHSRTVKQKLREFRAQIAAPAPTNNENRN